MKKLLSVLIMFLMISSLGFSQSKIGEFLLPMTDNRKKEMYQDFEINSFREPTKKGSFIVRPTMGVTGSALYPMWGNKTITDLEGNTIELPETDWNNFIGFEMKTFSQFGVGISYEHYKPMHSESTMYNDFSIDLLITMAVTETNPYAGAILSVSAFNIWNLKPSAGVGVKFVKDTPAKGLFYPAFNLRYQF